MLSLSKSWSNIEATPHLYNHDNAESGIASLMTADEFETLQSGHGFNCESPYPGLRPFQPAESEYFFGRDTQTKEVIDRLRQNRFVAVIGGSGSGKSSLVLAGAIPRLRTYAIKEAGDFWVPVIATPGTNHAETDSPLQRLAHKFCLELVELEPDQDKSRLNECVELLRQEHGLGALVQRFGRDLKNADGVDISRPEVQVNFLFLVDQFEELFHPSNAGGIVADDCRHLVNRIVEQFKTSHSQVCVALTMRSEHLNDCPRYEDLPDAINATAYLVKRLNGDQLRQAIEHPAHHFLRKYVAAERNRARVEGQLPSANQKWPQNIPFDPEVIKRILTDSDLVLARQDHADHLPLLQHLLFWIWSAAVARCMPSSIPDRLMLADLRVAVSPPCGTNGAHLDDSMNTLTACLQNRCEAIYESHNARHARWKDVFCSLAFKEPNTGTYSQQRAKMVALRARLKTEIDDNQALKSDLSPWLAPHSYLHWDNDSQTLKVAHETLIRRWERFRDWIDDEDYQFQIYIRLLEDCDRWINSPMLEKERCLSTGETLSRYEDAKLPEALQDHVQVARFRRLLGMDRDGQMMMEVAESAKMFLEKSREGRDRSEREGKRAEKRKQGLRQLTYAAVIGTIAALCLAVYAWAEISLAKKKETIGSGYIFAMETIGQIPNPPQFDDFDIPQLKLRDALTGLHVFDKGKALGVGPVEVLNWNNLYRGSLIFIQNSLLLSETRNIASLSIVLKSAPWELREAKGVSSSKNTQRCVSGHQISIEGAPLKNVPFYPSAQVKDDNGLILLKNNKVIYVYSATMNPSGHCILKDELLSAPPSETVRVGVDGDAENVVLEFSRYYQFYTIGWDDPEGITRAKLRVVIQKPPTQTFQLLEEMTALNSARQSFATDVTLGEKTFRLFDTTAQRVDGASWEAIWKDKDEMQRVYKDAEKQANSGDCTKHLEKVIANQKQKPTEVWELSADKDKKGNRTHCMLVSIAPGSPTYLATLYAISKQSFADDDKIHFPLFRDVNLGANSPTKYKMDIDSGWLAYESTSNQWRAMPWSLNAWRGLAKPVFDLGKPKLLPALNQKGSLVPLLFGEVKYPEAEVLLKELKDFTSPQEF